MAISPREWERDQKRDTKQSKKKITDNFLPTYLIQYVPSDDPDYEDQYIDSIRQYITEGEKVVIVGGGDGISTVAAAKQVHPSGKVDVFEGGMKEVQKTRSTVDINDVDEIVTVHHAIIANDYSLRSSAHGAEMISPTELPDCDTLAIDADGAEIPILEQIDINADRLIIEHHAVPDGDELVVEYQPGRIRSMTQELGYEIVEEQSEPARAYGCFEERIFVVERSRESVR